MNHAELVLPSDKAVITVGMKVYRRTETYDHDKQKYVYCISDDLVIEVDTQRRRFLLRKDDGSEVRVSLTNGIHDFFSYYSTAAGARAELRASLDCKISEALKRLRTEINTIENLRSALTNL